MPRKILKRKHLVDEADHAIGAEIVAEVADVVAAIRLAMKINRSQNLLRLQQAMIPSKKKRLHEDVEVSVVVAAEVDETEGIPSVRLRMIEKIVMIGLPAQSDLSSLLAKIVLLDQNVNLTEIPTHSQSFVKKTKRLSSSYLNS
jgi:hypothetical protein